MATYSPRANLAAYQSVQVHGAVDANSPHHLTLMLMDGLLQRLLAARGCLERGEKAQKALLLHRCGLILGELHASLDMKAGGDIAQNLNDLYEYMARQLLRANAEGRLASIDELISLLGEIRSAWVAIGPALRSAARVAAG